MTRVIYEPAVPALRMEGHAGAGPKGGDPVCAALSMLLYTLIAASPGADAALADGAAAVRGPGAYGVILAGLRLLAEQYPERVRIEVRT